MTALLRARALSAGYGGAEILAGINLAIAPGSIAALLGRNGAGKSTLIKTLIGLVRPTGGTITFADQDITNLPPWRIARLGLGYVPEERRIFTDLTVAENLMVGQQPPRDGHPAWTPARIFALFPNLSARAHASARQISGGEQQMLAIARTLMGNPTLLLLDEPSEGLAPVIVAEMISMLRRLRDSGVTILVAEQNLSFAAQLADTAVILETGRLVWTGSMAALSADPELRLRFLGV
jgi:branched-chain amino acid transport system ATP-binding protein